MKTIFAFLTTFCALTLFATSAFALRPLIHDHMADRDYKIARGAYRSFIKDYGTESVKWPDAEKEKTCRDINRALYSNRHELPFTDIFRQRDLKKQIKELEGFARDLSCPAKE